MKQIGVTRRVDELGRVVMPSEMRRAMGIANGDPVEFVSTDQGVLIRPYVGAYDGYHNTLKRLISAIEADDLAPERCKKAVPGLKVTLMKMRGLEADHEKPA